MTTGRGRALLLVGLLAVSGCVTTHRLDSQPIVPAETWALQCDENHATSGWLQSCLRRASTSPFSKAELWTAINPTDPSNVVLGAKDMNPELSRDCTWNRLAITHDAGRSWTELSIGGKLADRAPTGPYERWACNTDPMFAFTSDGVLHAILELYALGPGPTALGKESVTNVANGGVAFYLVESRDGGLTWSDPRDLLTLPGLVAAPDHPWLVVDPKTGTLHVALIDYLVGHRCYVMNIRAGDAMAELVVVQTPNLRGCSQAAMTADGVFVVGGHEPATVSQGTVVEGVRDVWFARSTDDGRTFSTPATAFAYLPLAGRFAESEHEANSILRVIGDPAEPQRLHAVYDGLDGKDGQVWFRTSLDAGRTWSDALDLSQDTSRHHQFMPGLAVAPGGTIHIFYFDKRYDEANNLIGVTYARTADHGRTWTNERITNISWDGSLARHQYGHAWVGDYIGVDAVGDDVWAAFPDASLGEAPSMAAAHVRRMG